MKEESNKVYLDNAPTMEHLSNYSMAQSKENSASLELARLLSFKGIFTSFMRTLLSGPRLL